MMPALAAGDDGDVDDRAVSAAADPIPTMPPFFPQGFMGSSFPSRSNLSIFSHVNNTVNNTRINDSNDDHDGTRRSNQILNK